MCPRSLFVGTIKVSTKAIILTHTLLVHTVTTVRLRFKRFLNHCKLTLVNLEVQNFPRLGLFPR